jgi:hypothetical protein
MEAIALGGEARQAQWAAVRARALAALLESTAKAGGGGHDVSDEPRDPSGKWTDGGGDGGGKGEHPGEGYSKHAYVDKNGVIHTSNVYDAQRALFENRKVALKQPKQISTLIKRLGETAAEMAEQGEEAPSFNLCNVSVEGTNLFCAEQLGIPRVEMPVIPAKQTKKFIKYLKEEGYKVEKDNEYAANLRATQSEIDGAKVATQMARIEKDGFYKRLVISKDDYILDGHHTWAGALGIDAQDNNLHDDKLIKIARVNISITKLLEEAEKWTKEHGIAKKPAGAKEWADVRARALAALREFDESKHPRVPAGSPEGGQFGTGGGGGEGASADEPKLDPEVINVGGDEWNRATARKLEREYQSVRPKLETMAAESVGQSAAQAAPPSEDDEPDGDPPYEPEEWWALSTSGQSQVEEEYVSWAKSDYESSESDYWYEEYAPHEAREKIAEEFNDGTDREWAEDALAKLDLPERGPFTNEQILKAVTINFEGNPGGSLKDPEFEWDDKYLDELKSPDPAQINLPGFETVEGHELLTDDMRAKIEKMLEKAFDKKGDNEAGSMDVPQWVSENAAESAGEGFGQMDDDDKFAWAKAHTSVIEDETTPGTGDYAEAPAEVAGMEIDALPTKYDPLNDTSGAQYQRTQKLARYLSVERTIQVLNERKLAQQFWTKPEVGQNVLRARIARIDSKLWGAWKDSSVTDDGKLLQLATSDELGGRMNLKTATDLDPGGIKARANKYYEDIGGYAGIKAYVRAKWETTQYLLDKGHIQTLNLYRGIDMPAEKFDKTFKHYPAHQLVNGFKYMPTLPVERNGAASTTTDLSVANGWKSHNRTAITLRAQVPRTAAVSVPAYGINIHSEHEVVVAGTAWRGWDAWAGGAPGLSNVPLQHAA